MSTLAGCTHDGSKGSMPMRPDAIAARMSRSESTTVAKYGVGAAREREDALAQIRPRGDHIVGPIDPLAREAPQDLDGARARGPPHRDVRARVTDDDALLRCAPQAVHRVPGEIRRGLRPRDRVPAEVDVDLARDSEATQDELAIRGALASHGRLEQSGVVEGVQRLARALIQLGDRDDLAAVDLAVLRSVADRVIRREIRPRDPEDLLEWQASHRADAVEVECRPAMRLDNAIRRIDDETDTVRERPVEIPQDGAEGHARHVFRRAAGPAAARTSRRVTRGAATSVGVAARSLRRRQARSAASSARRTCDRAPLVADGGAFRARRRARRDPVDRRTRS